MNVQNIIDNTYELTDEQAADVFVAIVELFNDRGRGLAKEIQTRLRADPDAVEEGLGWLEDLAGDKDVG
ncbi:hypothetical protein [Sphingomonas jaspsi]|uniref:hypothetical protein n=1 Tax=Sphingomonas jaspsi TaxID=392409 RepID=UPI0004AD08D7|nr:hypothetical protein [Sphingomonas jaspsi]